MNSTSRYAYSRNGALGRVDEKCLVRVQIPTVDSIDGSKVRYHVRITNIRSGQVWEVPRRFSEFLQLRNELIEFFSKTDKKCPGCRKYEKVLNLFEFPRKHVFTSVTPVVINYRKKALCNFVALLVSHTFTTTPKCPTCSGFAFTSVRDWLTTGVGAGVSSANADDAAGSFTIEAIRDSIKVKDFTNYYPVSNTMTVDQEGRFIESIVPFLTSPVKRTDNRPSRPNPRLLTPKQNFSSQLSASGYSISPPSPPSVDEFVIPKPIVLESPHMQNGVKTEDDEELYLFPFISIEDQKDQPVCEPLASEDSITGQLEKGQLKILRSSVEDNVKESLVQSCSGSMIDADDMDNEDDEGLLNMDFMIAVPHI